MRHTIRLLAAAAVLAVLAAACGPTAAAGAATVNGVTITRTQLEEAVRELVGDVESIPAEERAEQVGLQQRQILTFLITARILEDAAADHGVEVTDDDLDAVREEVLAAVGGEEQLGPALEGAGLTMDLFEQAYLPQQAYLTGLRESLLGDQEMQTRTVRHILVEDEELANDIVTQLDEGADFGELALEHSIDPGSGQAGGDLGPAPRGQYVPEFDDAAWNAQLGEIVGPVESQFGFHVLEVTEEGSTAASELAPEQIDQMVGQELNTIIETAFDEADVEVGAGLGVWDPTARQVVAEDEVGTEPPPTIGDDGGAPPEQAPDEAPEEELEEQ